MFFGFENDKNIEFKPVCLPLFYNNYIVPKCANKVS